MFTDYSWSHSLASLHAQSPLDSGGEVKCKIGGGTLLPNSAQSNPGYDLEDHPYNGPLLTRIDPWIQAFNFSDSIWDFSKAKTTSWVNPSVLVSERIEYCMVVEI